MSSEAPRPHNLHAFLIAAGCKINDEEERGGYRSGYSRCEAPDGRVCTLRGADHGNFAVWNGRGSPPDLTNKTVSVKRGALTRATWRAFTHWLNLDPAAGDRTGSAVGTLRWQRAVLRAVRKNPTHE